MKNNKTLLILTVSLLASIILGACGTQTSAEAPAETSADIPSPEEVSFADDVLPIIKSRCIKCHGGDKIEEGLLMRSYDEIMAGSDNGPIVVPGDIEGSLMVELLAAKEMPKKGPKLTPPQLQIITNWVSAGAPNN